MNHKYSTILVTGGAGFIGAHLIQKLLKTYKKIICVDNFNDYYDPQLKTDRLRTLAKNQNGKDWPKNFQLYKTDIKNLKALEKIFKKEKIDLICHLAAQAGVRFSLIKPFIYQRSNVLGTLNLLELAKKYQAKNFIFASSSSVYGNNQKIPFSEIDKVNQPASLYGATKIAGEALCYAYHSLYKIPCTCLRFFTVYGPWGRPDMAYFKFTKNILEGKPIEVYNFGKMSRDFTYIDDLVEGILKTIKQKFAFEIINLGHNKPISLLNFIKVIEKNTGKKAKKKGLPIQKGDIVKTWAKISKAKKLLNWEPKVSFNQGIKAFVSWYKKYYHFTHENRPTT